MEQRKMPHEYRETVNKVCPVCGDPFEGFKTKLYCSPACRRKRWWQENKDGANERRRDRPRRIDTGE